MTKIASRLAGWKLELLAKARRATLIDAVLMAMPPFLITNTRVPVGVLDDIEQICRKFLWGGKQGKWGMSLVDWDGTLCVGQRRRVAWASGRKLRDLGGLISLPTCC